AVTSFFYSAAGAILSSIAMALALKFHDRLFSFIGVSEIGAFAHNLGQIIVAAIIMENIKMFNYFPLLVLVGTFSGFFVVLSSNFIIKHMKKLSIGEKPLINHRSNDLALTDRLKEIHIIPDYDRRKDKNLLATIISTGTDKINTIELAAEILDTFNEE